MKKDRNKMSYYDYLRANEGQLEASVESILAIVNFSGERGKAIDFLSWRAQGANFLKYSEGLDPEEMREPDHITEWEMISPEQHISAPSLDGHHLRRVFGSMI